MVVHIAEKWQLFEDIFKKIIAVRLHFTKLMVFDIFLICLHSFKKTAAVCEQVGSRKLDMVHLPAFHAACNEDIIETFKKTIHASFISLRMFHAFAKLKSVVDIIERLPDFFRYDYIIGAFEQKGIQSPPMISDQPHTKVFGIVQQTKH